MAKGVEDDSYDYVLDMITDVRSEHGIKIDDLNDKVVFLIVLSSSTTFFMHPPCSYRVGRRPPKKYCRLSAGCRLRLRSIRATWRK